MRALTVVPAQANSARLDFGSVNADRRHDEAGAAALAGADPAWLARLITRRVPLARRAEARTRAPDDVEPLIEFAA